MCVCVRACVCVCTGVRESWTLEVNTICLVISVYFFTSKDLKMHVTLSTLCICLGLYTTCQPQILLVVFFILTLTADWLIVCQWVEFSI